MFALGICALCYIFSKDYPQYYDWGKCELRFDKVNADLDYLDTQAKYDKNLVKIVRGLLSPEPSARPSLEKLKAQLASRDS